MPKNAFAARAPPQTPLGELITLPQRSPDLARFKGPTFKGREGEGRKERGDGRERGRERGIPILLFPHFETWLSVPIRSYQPAGTGVGAQSTLGASHFCRKLCV